MKFCKDFVHFFVYGGVDFILIEEKEGFFLRGIRFVDEQVEMGERLCYDWLSKEVVV